MTIQGADALARRYIETLGAGQIEGCMRLFHEQALIKFPASLVGPRALTKAQFGAMLSNMPNVFEERPTYTLTGQTSEDVRSCIEFNGVGRLKDGSEFRNEYCIVFVVAHGLIVE